MPPTEFYRLLYSELVLIMEGYRDRRKRELRATREEHAWMVSWLLLPHKAEDADPITPDQLMGRKTRGKRRAKPMSREQARARGAALFAAAQAQKKNQKGR